MKIGASTLAGLKDDLCDSLEFIESLGIDYAEILLQYPNENPDLDIFESYNLGYTVHAPFMDLNIASLNTKSRLNSVSQIKDSIDFASKIGADTVVVHPGLVTFLARNFLDEVYKLANGSIKEIGEYGNDLGVTATIENMPSFDTMIYQSMNDLDALLNEYEMFMTFDIGHAHHVGISPDEMYFDSIKHIHIHDNKGDEDSHLALGEGTIDLKYIINTFESKNYDGIYMIEVNDMDSIKKSYEFLKKI